MYSYRLIVLGTVVLVAAGFVYAMSPDQASERAVVNGEAIRMASSQDAAISRWAADQGLEYVPAPRRTLADDEVIDATDEMTAIELRGADLNRRDVPPADVSRQSRGITVMADPEGGAPVIVYETEEARRERLSGKIRIHSLEDLARLNTRSEDELNKLERGDVDVNIYRIRDDVNRGLFDLGRKIRQIDQDYVIPPARNASGTASTGGIVWAPGAREEMRRRQLTY